MQQQTELPADINPGIRKIVSHLRRFGFNTTDSGDGETHLYECDRDYGYVVIRVEPEALITEARRLQQILREIGICTGCIVPEGVASPPTIQANYSPDDGLALLDLSFVHDRLIGPPVDANGDSPYRKRSHPIPAFFRIDRARVRYPTPSDPPDAPPAVSAAFLRGWMECVQDDCENVPFAGIGGAHMRHDPHVPKYVPPETEAEWIEGYFAAVFNQYGEDWAGGD